ncbi:MAG: ThuA domain-containing protein [Thermoguttaceae bacterium]|nr:ThuA domain-containing protein [Thermoguttaceae bacterium]MDW8077413.1 ThuA domain-containing protein [Thermoguttaceae bacterium]
MHHFRAVFVALTILAGIGFSRVAAQEATAPPVRVVITTGGHGFDADGFFGMFRAMPGVSFEVIELPRQADLLAPPLRQKADCLVFYDMVGDLPREAREQLVALLNQGIGVVALHHNLGANRTWGDYRFIIGGKFIFEKCELDGQSYDTTPWKHGQRLKIKVADPKHPVTRGLTDFDVEDETYGRFYTAADIHVLLRTDHPDNNPIVAWTKKFGQSRIVYIQLGHDRGAYDNPNYRKLVHQAILWAAGKLDSPQ